jgi:hypothetical protein
VEEAGMERLIKALGDDGLDDFEQMQLHITLGGDGAEEDDQDSEDDGFMSLALLTVAVDINVPAYNLAGICSRHRISVRLFYT